MLWLRSSQVCVRMEKFRVELRCVRDELSFGHGLCPYVTYVHATVWYGDWWYFTFTAFSALFTHSLLNWTLFIGKLTKHSLRRGSSKYIIVIFIVDSSINLAVLFPAQMAIFWVADPKRYSKIRVGIWFVRIDYKNRKDNVLLRFSLYIIWLATFFTTRSVYIVSRVLTHCNDSLTKT